MRIVFFLLETLFFFLMAMALLRAWMNHLRVPMQVQPGRFVMAISDWLVQPLRRVLPAALAAGVVVLWLSRSHWAGTRNGGQLAALARGGTVAALALPAIVGVVGDDAWRFALAPGFC